ncbi:hypothetical protein V492_02977 [Pseudogymnoascus sp. VKM F-4246]|nr:hypothetical protein V492_02977 [Pseudogymnoascus sp. VKM F-4246]
MVPPSQSLNLDAEAISGILGSISIACWVTVFTPQILENFRRGSAESLSVEFIVIWSLGDLCNVIGGILQGVLPTMLILAVYYVLADIRTLAPIQRSGSHAPLPGHAAGRGDEAQAPSDTLADGPAEPVCGGYGCRGGDLWVVGEQRVAAWATEPRSWARPGATGP